ncbi:MAG TPA: histidinol-phosphate transaminase [Bryobacteraceae bacterium]
MALVPPYIAKLRPYEAGRSIEEVKRQFGLTRVAKLGSNENPLGTSPRATEAVHKALGAGLNRYGDGGLALRHALADRFGVSMKNVICGSGSESLLSSIVRTFLGDDDEVLTTEAAFIGFKVTALSRGVTYREVPYRDYHYDLPALAAAITPKTKIIYLANPNNPTGTIFTRQEFDAFYARVPERVLIIQDEAYFEYAQRTPDYPDSLGYRYDNVIALRTFSKAYGLAGIRVGYGFAHEDLITQLLKIKLPFEPSGLAQAAAIAALDDTEFIEQTLELNARSLRMLHDGLHELGYRTAPSRANFVMVPLDSAEAAAALTRQLLEQGVIVRPLAAFGLPHAVRISTGTIEETEMCLSAIARAAKEEIVCQS